MEITPEFRKQFQDLVNKAHDTALEKGWWNPAKTFGEQILLMHCELSEAVEEYRGGFAPHEVYYPSNPNGMDPNHKHDKPEGVPIELADLVIRLFDTCSYYNIDILDAILVKMTYNETRSHRHGGKVL